MPPVWKEDRLIELFDIDVLGRLRPQTLFAFLLNSAWNHANKSVYGYNELSARNLMWVLIKMQIFINRLPMWGEEITIKTWGKRVVKLYALRDFAVTSETGEKLISATSSWMILDKTSGRPQRFNKTSDNFPWQGGVDELETRLEKVQELKKGKPTASFHVHFSDIDVNRHVNSSKYLEWVIDSHSQEYLEANQIKSIEMSFLSEAMPNDEVTVYSENAGRMELCSVTRAADEKELCRAQFDWQAAIKA